METLKKIFGNTTHLKLLLLFYNNDGYFDNITGLTKQLGKSHVTVRKVVSDLVSAGILKELDIGKSRVVMINTENPCTKAVFQFLNEIKKIEEEKRKRESAKERLFQMY
ncbi:MAG: hypothetical protein N2V77_02940 [Canidatus Methanoxibalbensis ujae]|nr:hypothetical protein [Candidatus Methanoxibalbensis ujae]MCW7077608.1 hypothetical protein [Candidatus Methanoxibalbensis ujae]